LLEVSEIEIPLWKPKWNEKALATHLKRIGPTAFNRGLRNIALSNKDRTFPSFELCVFPDNKISDFRKKSFPVFSGVDLATKKRKGTSIFTLAKNTKNNIYIPIDIRFGKWTGPRLLKEIKAVNRIFKPKSFLVENNSLQDMVIDFLKEDAKTSEDKSKPSIKGFCTGSNKADLETGLPSLEVDFYNERWKIGFADREHKLTCKCGFCKFKDEVLGHPLYPSTDVLMSAWFARENARKSAVGKIRIL
jgi:hypothetical protein